jgi:hypothetical protein
MSNNIESLGPAPEHDGAPETVDTDQAGPATPPAPDPAPGESRPPRRRRNRVLIALAVIVALIVLATGGVVVADAVAGTPELSFVEDDVSALGGTVQVTGTATNTGAGDAQNVGVEVTLAVGAGLTGSATIPTLAHENSSPFNLSIDLAGGSLPLNFETSSKTHWDVPQFDTQNNGGSFQYSGHIYGTRTGSVHNAGPGEAQNVVLTITFANDLEGKNLISSGTNNLGTVAAGASLPYSVKVDLGANPPHTVYWGWRVAWSEPSVSAADIKSTWVGGTVTLAGSVTNIGKAPASGVVVVRTLLDANGQPIGSVTANLGRLAPGAKADYKLTFPLEQKSFREITRRTVKLSWKEVHYFFVRSTQTRT